MSESTLPGEAGFTVPRFGARSDERLARRAAQGDERAFAAIFRRYSQDLYRYCLAIVGNPADAQDALQNVMVKAMRALPGERREIKLKPWLYRVAHNESVDLLRQRRGGEELDPEAPARGDGLAETVERRRRLRLLFADLDELPERQRGALVMRELSGLDFDQIGEALGTSPAVARQTVYEARLSLRQMDAGREMSCDAVARALSDADGRTLRRRDVRAHLRSCPECRAFRAGIEGRRRDFAALSPLPAIAAAALLKGALGSTAASAGSGAAGGGAGGLGGALGTASGAGAGGLGGALGTAGGAGLVAKSAATLAVVAAIGVGAADRAGIVHIGGSGGGEATRAAAPGSGGGSGPPAASAGSGAVRGSGGRAATGALRTGAHHGLGIAAAALGASSAGRAQAAGGANAPAAANATAHGPAGHSRAHGAGSAASGGSGHHGNAASRGQHGAHGRGQSANHKGAHGGGHRAQSTRGKQGAGEHMGTQPGASHPQSVKPAPPRHEGAPEGASEKPREAHADELEATSPAPAGAAAGESFP
jgi:RNA polymerase sigma factor (sigma-70 family)